MVLGSTKSTPLYDATNSHCSARQAQAHTTTHVLSRLFFHCLLTLHTASIYLDFHGEIVHQTPRLLVHYDLPIKQELDVLIVQILISALPSELKKSFAIDLYAFLPFIAQPSPPVCSSRKDHLYDASNNYSRTTPGTSNTTDATNTSVSHMFHQSGDVHLSSRRGAIHVDPLEIKKAGAPSHSDFIESLILS